MNSPVRPVRPSEATALLKSRPEMIVLDVRTPGEHAAHRIPGSALIPIRELGARWRELSPRQPLLIHCEHGVRSRNAAGFLAEMGFTEIHDLAGGLAAWDPRGDGPLVSGPSDPHENPLAPPELIDWLPRHRALPAAGARALDLAAGRGRIARLLKAEGFTVIAVDRELAPLLSAGIGAKAIDLEAAGGSEALRALGEFELIAAANYLHRPLLPVLAAMLKPGGLLFYRTFVADPRATSGPKNPGFLLQPGELPGAFAALELLEYQDRFDGEKRVASLLARRD